MKVRPPKPWNSLSPAQREAITEHARNVARDQTERDGRIMLDLYIKMVCKTLHDVFGFGEKRLYLFLGHHKRLFYEQVEMVKDGTQIQYLNDEMAKIFRKSGFPSQFFDKMLGEVEPPQEEL